MSSLTYAAFAAINAETFQPSFQTAWSKGSMPVLNSGVKPSAFLPLGEFNVETDQDSFITNFNILYLERIEGFKKIKKEKGEKERNMEWRVRLKRKAESTNSNTSSSSNTTNTRDFKVSEERDRLKAIRAYQALKQSKGNGHLQKGGQGGKGSKQKRMKMMVDHKRPSMRVSEFGSGMKSGGGGGGEGGGGSRRRISKAEKKRIAREARANNK